VIRYPKLAGDIKKLRADKAERHAENSGGFF
jgi:hypothetical protein